MRIMLRDFVALVPSFAKHATARALVAALAIGSMNAGCGIKGPLKPAPPPPPAAPASATPDTLAAPPVKPAEPPVSTSPLVRPPVKP